MVNGALSLGAFVGVLLSGGFVYWQVGRYAAPQVPVSLFDERREVYSFVIGLFVGVPLSLFLIFLTNAAANGALTSALVDVAFLAIGGELAQWALLRSRYFGEGSSAPFYALGLRAGIGGILALAIVTQYLEGSTLTLEGLALTLIESVALLAIQVTAGLVGLPARGVSAPRLGRPVSAALLAAGGLGLLVVATSSGTVDGILGAGAVIAIAAVLYRGRRDVTLGTIHPPGAPVPVPTPFGRRGP
ncbi:MAG: hypothetical protein L3K15_00625 [Thermoplasmata archaeon]|nr:hypothetical protein [Thermoplasmata archaeon]